MLKVENNQDIWVSASFVRGGNLSNFNFAQNLKYNYKNIYKGKLKGLMIRAEINEWIPRVSL